MDFNIRRAHKLYDKAVSAFLDKEWAECDRLASLAIAASPTYVQDMYLVRSSARRKMKHLDEALLDCQTMIAQNKTCFQAKYQYASILKLKKNYGELLSYLSKVLLNLDSRSEWHSKFKALLEATRYTVGYRAAVQMFDILPQELVYKIFQLLDFFSILKCRLVCRKWKQHIERDPKMFTSIFWKFSMSSNESLIKSRHAFIKFLALSNYQVKHIETIPAPVWNVWQAQIIKLAPSVKSLAINASNTEQIVWSKPLDNLERLILIDCSLSQVLLSLKNCPRIRNLYARIRDLQGVESVVSSVSNDETDSSELETIHLDFPCDYKIPLQDSDCLANIIGQANDLKRLIITNVNFPLRITSQLEYLEISFPSNILENLRSNIIIEHIRDFVMHPPQSLKVLKINSLDVFLNIADYSDLSLEDNLNSTQLDTLQISNDHNTKLWDLITYRECYRCFVAYTRNLHHLSLKSFNMSHEVFTEILVNFPCVKILDFTSTHINDGWIKELPNLQNLQVLILDHCHLIQYRTIMALVRQCKIIGRPLERISIAGLEFRREAYEYVTKEGIAIDNWNRQLLV